MRWVGGRRRRRRTGNWKIYFWRTQMARNSSERNMIYDCSGCECVLCHSPAFSPPFAPSNAHNRTTFYWLFWRTVIHMRKLQFYIIINGNVLFLCWLCNHPPKRPMKGTFTRIFLILYLHRSMTGSEEWADRLRYGRQDSNELNESCIVRV